MKRVRVIAWGRVQGVWFRESTRMEAERLGVGGWVRNLPDGRVEAQFMGPPAAVDEIVAWCRRGPEHANVAGIEVIEGSDTGTPAGGTTGATGNQSAPGLGTDIANTPDAAFRVLR